MCRQFHGGMYELVTRRLPNFTVAIIVRITSGCRWWARAVKLPDALCTVYVGLSVLQATIDGKLPKCANHSTVQQLQHSVTTKQQQLCCMLVLDVRSCTFCHLLCNAVRSDRPKEIKGGVIFQQSAWHSIDCIYAQVSAIRHSGRSLLHCSEPAGNTSHGS